MQTLTVTTSIAGGAALERGEFLTHGRPAQALSTALMKVRWSVTAIALRGASRNEGPPHPMMRVIAGGIKVWEVF